MKGLKLAIIIGFACMFIAGLAVGWTRAIVPIKTSEQPRSWLGTQLDLSARQEEQVKKIWQEASAAQPDSRLFKEADKQRDEQVRAILTDDQKKQLDEITRAHDERIAALRAQRDKVWQESEKKTRALLTPEQQKKFDQITKDGHRHGRGPMRSTAPTTAPTAH